jgi:hypothetical protein
MPKLELPLGSSEAYGQIAKTIIYQGTHARSYAVPKDPKSDGQVAQRSIFRDVTKMISTGQIYMRGASRTAFGNRWFQVLYKAAMDRFAGDDSSWAWLSSGVRDELNQYAPYQQTEMEPGRVWYSVSLALNNSTAGLLNMPGWDPLVPENWAEFWARDLTGVFYPGSWDDAEDVGSLNPGWVSVPWTGAHGGNIIKSAGNVLAAFTLYFWGRQVRVIHTKDTIFGSFNWTLDSMTWDEFSQYSATTVNGSVFSTPVAIEGLHRFVMSSWFASPNWSQINIDRIDIL